MTPWILLALALWFAQSLLAPSLRYLSSPALGPALRTALGPRDTQPKMPVMGERSARAFANLSEAMPVFLALALLLEVQGAGGGSATTGALVFLVARVLYVPAYLSGVPGVRSTAWAVGHLGLAMMALAAWTAA